MQNDSSKVLALNRAAFAVRDTNEQTAFAYALQANELATKLKFKKGLGVVAANLGWLYFRKGNFVKAYELSVEGLTLNQQFGNKKEAAECIFNIGLIDSRLKKYDSALISFKQSFNLFKNEQDDLGMSKNLNSSAYCLVKLKKLDSAKSIAIQSIQLAGGNQLRLAASKRTLGDIYFEEGYYHDALKVLEESKHHGDASKNDFAMIASRYRIGKIYNKLNNPDMALEYLQQNIEIASRHNIENRLRSTYQFMSDAYAKKKDFTNAYKFLTLANQQKDSLNEQLSEQQFALAQAKHETSLKNARITLLTKDSQLKASEIRNQQLLIYFGTGTLLVLIALVFSIYRGYSNSRIANKLLVTRKEMIKAQADELKQLNNTKDKILSIISHDLRSPLSGLQGLLNLIGQEALSQKEFLEHSIGLRQNLEFVRNDLDNLLHWANAQVKELKPEFKNVLAFEVVQEKMNVLSELAKTKNITLKNEVPANLYIHSDENHLGLIVRNLLANAIKFTQPNGIVSVHTTIVDNTVQLTVSDTGTGMTDEELNKLFKTESHFTKHGTQNEKGMGLGLLLVKEFVQINHGSISVTSKLGHGSSFTVSFKGDYFDDLNAKSA